MRDVVAAELDDVGLARLRARLGHHERLGHLAPFFVRDGDDRHLLHVRVPVDGVLHLDGRDVLAAADDDVLLAVAKLGVAVRVHDRQVAAVEPAAAEGFGGNLGLLVVAEHDVVAAHHHLAQGLGVGGHVAHVVVHHAHLAGGDVRHALPRLFARPLVNRQLVPFLVPGADAVRAVGLGEAVDVENLGAERLHVGDDRRRRRRRRGDNVQLAGEDGGLGARMVDQRYQHDGRAAQVGDLLPLDEVEHPGRLQPPQADVRAGHRGHAPREAPAVAVKHRQRPQVGRAVVHADLQRRGHGVQVAAAVRVQHPLGVAGGAAGVIDADRLVFVLHRAVQQRVRAGGQKRLVIRSFIQGLADVTVLDVHHRLDAGQLVPHRADQFRQFRVDAQHLAAGMVEDVGDFRRRQPGVDGHQDGPGQRHAEVRLQHGRDVGAQEADAVALDHADAVQSGRQPVHPVLQLPVGGARFVVDHGCFVRIDARSAGEKTEGGERGVIDR